MTLRNSEYSKNLIKIIDNLGEKFQGFYVSGNCVGNICLIDDCGKDATHKVGEEMLDGEPFPERHNLTNYVCCDHYQNVFGPIAKSQCEGNKHPLYYEKIKEAGSNLENK
jgi:hypothetical protein